MNKKNTLNHAVQSGPNGAQPDILEKLKQNPF